jgi:hypothetical protein
MPHLQKASVLFEFFDLTGIVGKSRAITGAGQAEE